MQPNPFPVRATVLVFLTLAAVRLLAGVEVTALRCESRVNPPGIDASTPRLSWQLDDDALTLRRRTALGFVFQFHHLLPAFTAIENVMMPMLGDAGFPNAAMAERAAALIRDDLEVLGKVRKSEVEGARQEVVQVALRLEADAADKMTY